MLQNFVTCVLSGLPWNIRAVAGPPRYSKAVQTIDAKVRANTGAVLEESKRTGCTPRQAAVALAERRVPQAMSYRCCS